MIRLNETVAISRSPGEVFASIADLDNFPKWRANLVSIEILTGGRTGVGTRCTEVVQVGPLRATGTCNVMEISPGRTMAFKAVSAGLIYDGRILVEPSDEGSRLTLTGDVHPKGPLKLMQRVVRGKLERGIKQEATSLKELLDRQ